jgi:uncharacterized protein (DUF3084 family)
VSPDVLVPVLGLFGGLTLAVLAALRFQREDAGKVVAQQGVVFENMQGLNDELQEALERCREERQRREKELAECRLELDKANGTSDELRAECRKLEALLRACTHQQERLEQRLVELGEDPHEA